MGWRGMLDRLRGRVPDQPAPTPASDLPPCPPHLAAEPVLREFAAPRQPAGFRIEHIILQRRFHLYTTLGSASGPREAQRRLLQGHPHLARLFLFHADGHLREAALRALTGPLDHPVEVYGLAARLNDWAPEVRTSARIAVGRCFPPTPAAVLAPACATLLAEAPNWRRWSDGGAFLTRMITDRPDLVAEIATHHGGQAGAGVLLRRLMQGPHLDPLLEGLFLTAGQPNIRAMALDTLGHGRACWPTGQSVIRWTDRSMGEYRRVPEYDQRVVTVTADLPRLLATALRDRAAMVRSCALDILTTRRAEPALQGLIADLVPPLLQDRNPGVRRRADYLLARMAQPGG